MAGPLLRVPSLRYLITLIALLTTVHYFLSYTSPTYASNTAYFPSRRPQTDGTRQERLGKETSGEDWELSASSPDWSSDNESGRPINETVGGRRANAAYVILARNSDVWEIVESIRGMEDRFNRKYHYPYVFLNDEPFSDEFKKYTTGAASGPCSYGLVPKEHWSDTPEWIDQDRAKRAREQMKKDNVMYGESISYRAMCRYQSGFFYHHPLLDQYEFYWRIEPHVKYFCDLSYDPFLLMQDKKLKYGFTISLYEYEETIHTLWKTTKEFIDANPQYLTTPSQMEFLTDDGGKDYNHCHFWSNFEIGSLDFFRSEPYQKYFDYLDKAGGFYYERWGDAPVHSLAAALFLRPDEMHYFQDIGYRHEPFQHCPQNAEDRCACNPKDSFEFHGYSCTEKWKKVVGYVDGQ